MHGQPAIATAVSKHLIATADQTDTKRIEVIFLDNTFTLALENLPAYANNIKNRYQAYQQQTHNIKTVLSHPADLIMMLIDNLTKEKSLNTGLTFHIESNLPIGCGMGASAALIVACQTALCDLLSIDLSNADRFTIAQTVEHYQHGKSSGLDVQLALNGGTLEIQGQHKTPFTYHCNTLFAVETGQPQSATGECVHHVTQRFQQDTKLWQAFAECTKTMKSALIKEDFQLLTCAMRENHQLLTKIGVVPQKVQRFISDIESAGQAAKISGAGSIKGEHGGMVIVACEQPNLLKTLCERYQFPFFKIHKESRGAHCL